MALYKYAPQRYNDSLISLGNLRVGTLHDFRNTEHRKGVGDASEGKKDVTYTIDKLDEVGIRGEHAHAMKMFGAIYCDETSSVNADGLKMGQSFDSPDRYVLCLSYERSSNVMASLDGADSCLELVDPDGFINRLTKTLNSIAAVELVSRFQVVTYQARVEVWNRSDWGNDPVYIKGVEYKQQKEVRAVWVPKYKGAITPVNLNDIELVNFFKFVDV